MSNSIRLAKRLAEQIPCSRQESEQYIAGGWVSVDGQVIEEPGYRIEQQQLVELHPKANLAPLTDITILWHKPAGVSADFLAHNLTLDKLAQGDRSGLRFLKRHTTNLTLTNPIETEASGLVVFSQDFNINRKLIDGSAKIEQEFLVEVSGTIISGGLALLNHGLSWNGRTIAPVKVSWQNETRLRFAIKGVQLQQIQHMCQQVGLSVVSMRRLRIGRISLSSLPMGEWRYLLGYERF